MKSIYDNLLNHKKGFTVIEIMLVVILIGTLSLLAVPDHINFLARANVIQKSNDIALVQYHINMQSVKSGVFIPEGSVLVSYSDINSQIEQDIVYDVSGLVEELDSTVDYYDITNTEMLKGQNTQLVGTFISDINGNVYYMDEE